ncbi:MAG: hypothetical protein JW850_15240 [Thermoflexales bacterium]|nr:hypothetical protein [Thermoflexales bacterium]
MAKATSRTTKSSKDDKGKRVAPQPVQLPFNFKWDTRQAESVGAVLLILVAPLTLLALLGLTSGFGIDGWVNALRRLFGWGAFVIPLALGWGGYVLLRRQDSQPGFPWSKLIGLEIAFFCGLGLLHSLAVWADPWQLLEKSGGGGWFGWGLAAWTSDVLGGRVLSAIALLLGTAGGLALVFPGQLRAALQKWSGALAAVEAARPQQVESPLTPPPRRATEPVSPKPLPGLRPARQAGAVALKNLAAPERKTRPVKRDRNLPPLDLLEQLTSEAISEDEIKQRAELIRDTLRQFGLETNIVGYSVGPAVTQYAVEPGFIERSMADGNVRRQKVRVGQIASLSSDLALALAAATLRIEAPVPGQSYVGIEVPNSHVSLVSLRGVMESQPFRKIASKPLAVALGKDVSGQSIVTDMGSMPHLLIAGTTGSGKSVCINALIACLVLNNQPEDLKLVMIDPKMVELVRWNGLPHLYGKVETDLTRIVGVLRWVTREMDARYKRFAELGARNLTDYNQKVTERDKMDELDAEEGKLPQVVVFIDELADLMMLAPVEIEKTICRIAQMARATGIHLVMATQRPSTDVVTGLIKANFPARISFAVASSVDSRVILDGVGAETLLGKGDMLYQAPDAGHPLRVQGCYVSDRETEQIVKYWQDKLAAEGVEPEEAPWERAMGQAALSGGGGLEGELGAEDDEKLLQQAIALVQRRRGASASLLQRKLRIGYPKAARLIEQMEEMGVIGPPEAAGRVRKVFAQPESD